jgi:acyl transferase domain-containing protein
LEHWDVDALSGGGAAATLPARFGGFVPDTDLFDVSMFGLSGGEAELMDAQQRLLLEAALEALCQAGASLSQPSSTTVAVGIASAEYNNHLVPRYTAGISAYSSTGGALSVASGRLSYTFGFKGAALSVDTACSSSLVASHLAAGNVFSGVSSGGLTAGAGLLLSPDTTAMFHKAGMLAADGRCKTLDAAADGYVRGEAIGAMLLQAVQQGDSECHGWLALFSGSAVNQDGRSSSLTAPNGPSQQEVMRQALAFAGLVAAAICQLQMHGTGTPLGDPIEVGAASAVLVDGARRVLPLAASTAKACIGHTEAAAGVMGLTHASVALSHRLTHGESRCPVTAWCCMPAACA